MTSETYSQGYYYFGYNAFDSSNNYTSFSLADCPIVVKDKIISINPKIMKLNFEYAFEYLGEKLIAVKKSETVVKIYEVLVDTRGRGSFQK